MVDIIAAMSKVLRKMPSAKNLTQIMSASSQGRISRLDPMNNVTPHTLAGYLKRAAEGETLDYLRFATDMEEKDPHYASVLATRKLAVTGLQPHIVPGGQDKRSEDIAYALRYLIEAPAFAGLLRDLLDGLGKGWSVAEIIWEHGPVWRPARYAHVPPQFIQFDVDHQTQLLSKDGRSADALAPYKFVTHVPHFRSGAPVRGGLARLAAWSYLYKAYAAKDWLGFLEVYGLPLRVGRYGPDVSEKDIKILHQAVAGLGHNASAVLPEAMNIEFVSPTGRQSGDNFKSLAEWVDRQVSKAVLGQTMTTDDGSSRSQAEVHDKVRRDILRADASQLAASINRELVQPFVDINFGIQEHYPRLTLPLPGEYDLPVLTNALKIFVPMGMEVDAGGVREMYGLPAPVEGGTILRLPAPDGSRKMEGQRAALRERPQPDDIDGIIDDGLADWQEDFEPVLKPVEKAVKSASSYEEALVNLDGAPASMDSGGLAHRIGRTSFKAKGLGDISD